MTTKFFIFNFTKIKSFINSLYALHTFDTPNIHAKHKYSLREISYLIKQKYKVSYNPSTIMKWSVKHGWQDIWNEEIRQGIIETITEIYSEDLKIEPSDLKDKKAIQKKFNAFKFLQYAKDKIFILSSQPQLSYYSQRVHLAKKN